MSYAEDETTIDSLDSRVLQREAALATQRRNWYTEDEETMEGTEAGADGETRADDLSTMDDTTTDGGSRRKYRPRIDPEAIKQEQKRDPSILTEELTNNLREFINLCEQIKAAKEETNILIARKTELENEISQFMIQHNVPAFKTPNGKISVYQAKTVKPLNKDFLRETIAAKIPDKTVVEELTNAAFSARPTVSTQKIKVTPAKRD